MYILLSNFSFYISLLLGFFSYLIFFTSLRNKFLIFVLLIIFYSMWGFSLNLDGMMLIFLIAEFTIVLFFLMTYMQLYANFTFSARIYSFSPLLIFFMFFFLKNNFYHNFFYFISYYKYFSHVVSSDFFLLYYFLFHKIFIIIIFFTFIITFFSLFFILLYFNLKVLKISLLKNSKSIYFLRKQNLLKQTIFRSSLCSFQI